MESYEEFCSRILARLRTEHKEPMCGQKRAPSFIRFHGRAVLTPLLSEEQRRVMALLRQRAVQLDAERGQWSQVRGVPKAAWADPSAGDPHQSSAKVSHTIGSGSTQVHEEQMPRETQAPPADCCQNSLMLAPDPAWPPGGEPTGSQSAGRGEVEERGQGEVEERGQGEVEERGLGEEGSSSPAVSLGALLWKSRGYMEREQAGGGVRGDCWRPLVSEEALSDTDGESAVEGGGAKGERTSYSWTHIAPSPTPAHCRPGSDPNGSPNSPPHRRRPRPVSSGNISVSYPAEVAETSPEGGALGHVGGAQGLVGGAQGHVGSAQGHLGGAQGHVGGVQGHEGGAQGHVGGAQGPVGGAQGPVGGAQGPVGGAQGHVGGVHGYEGGAQRHVGGSRGIMKTERSHSPQGYQSGSLTGTHPVSPLECELTVPEFRRRSHTLDSLTRSAPDRTQERMPRFIVSYPGWAPQRLRHSQPAPPHKMENPPTLLPRPLLAPSLPKHGLETQHLSVLGTSMDQDQDQNSKTGEAQRQVKALEEMRWKLEEEHALQLSFLISEQEREQQCLQQKLEEKERRLKEYSGEPLTLWMNRNQDEFPPVSPARPARPALIPAERSPGCRMGDPSRLSPRVSQPAVHPPVYLWGLGQGLTPQLLGALCRLGAIARGFLTRRLLNTEKLKHLRQTVRDTQAFIQSFQTEAPLKRGSLSQQDISLQERVRAQLQAALFDVHDIFFQMSLGGRLAILRQDRELRAERRIREMEKVKSPKDRVAWSAATQKSLERKKQRVRDSPGQSKKVQPKPKSPPTNRRLYRKTPEERVRRSHSPRKRHSLG